MRGRALAVVVGALLVAGCREPDRQSGSRPTESDLGLSAEVSMALRWSRSTSAQRRQAALRILRGLVEAPLGEADRAKVESRIRAIIARDDTRYVIADAIAVLEVVTRGDFVAELIEVVDGGSAAARSAATEALVAAAGPADLEAVLAALGPFDDPAVLENRKEIVEFLGRVGGQRAALALLALIKATESSEAEKLGEVLATTGASTPVMIEALESLAKKEHYPKGRAAIIETLVRRGDPAATPALLDILRRRDNYIQDEVIEALATMRDPAAAADLVKRYGGTKPGSSEREELEKALRGFPGVLWPAPSAERPANLTPRLVPEAQLRTLAGAYRANYASRDKK